MEPLTLCQKAKFRVISKLTRETEQFWLDVIQSTHCPFALNKITHNEKTDTEESNKAFVF